MMQLYRTTKSLQQGREMLAEAQRIAKVGSWELDIVNNVLSWSDEIFRLFELDPQKFDATYEAFLNAIHPDDREAVNRAYTDSLKIRQPYEIEHRLLMADGRIKYVHERCETQYDADGKPLRSVGTVQDITERKHLEERLAKREQEFRALVEHSPDTIARYDGRCRCTYSNPAFDAYAGMPHKALLGITPIQQFPDSSQAIALEKKLRQVMEIGVEGEYEFTWSTPDKEITNHIRLVPEQDIHGDVTSVLAIGRDITNMKDAEKQLRQLLDNQPDVIVRYDTQCRRLYANPKFEEVNGVTAREVLGKTPVELCGKLRPMATEYQEMIERVLEFGRHEQMELYLYDAECKEKIHDVRATPEFGPGGDVVSVLVIGHDITEVKQAEQVLKLREQEFRTLAENSPDCIARFNRECRFVYVNPTFEKWFGYRLDELRDETPKQVPGLLEAEFIQDKVEQVLESGKAEEFEHGVRMAREGAVWSLISIFPEFSEAGEVTFVQVLLRDISARRKMEENLRMAASVFNVASEGIIITDTKAVILDVNPAFEQISGYMRHEVLGERPSILNSGRQGKDFYVSMWQKLVMHGSWSGEIVNRRKDGETYTEHLNITSVSDEEGEVIRYVGVFTDISLAKQQERRLEYIAHHDPLTGLPNRVLLTDRLEQAIAHAERSGTMFAILYLDVDGFKPVNDRFGHDVGDSVLQELSGRLKKVLRSSDTVARIGGDEFVLLLSGQSNKKECEYTAHRILASIARPITLSNQEIYLSASIGISIYPSDTNDPDLLLRHADQAMYVAKRMGRNQFVFSGQDKNSKSNLYSRLAHELRLALKQKQIDVYYQPIVDLSTGRIVKAEALARWTHPELGFISPAEFIPVAEDAGLIQELGDQVFKKAAHIASEWNHTLSFDDGVALRVGVNCSPRQFYSRDGVDAWVKYLYEKGVSGELIDIEITEGLLLDDSPAVVRQLNQLRSQGVSISLDDFGTGFSALSYLKKFDIDYLKIDRSFVRELEHSPDDVAIVEAIISMAHRLGITVIAEGVETKAQLDLLAAADCNLAQGYYFAKPMPEEEFLYYVESIKKTGPNAIDSFQHEKHQHI